MPKHFVLDTNVLLHDPKGVLTAFADNHIIIPGIVTEELDRLKRDAFVGYEAREISRLLEEFRNGGDIAEGIRTVGGGLLRIDYDPVRQRELPMGFKETPDNIILLSAKRLKKSLNGDSGLVVLVTKDINMRLKANAWGIKAEDYQRNKTGAIDTLYSGLTHLPASESDISEIHREGFLTLPEEGLLVERLVKMPPNVCCVLNAGDENGKSALAIYKKKDHLLKLVEKSGRRKGKGDKVVPRNIYQCLAHDLMVEEDVTIVSLAGKTGSGKTLMALLAGVELLGKQEVKRIMVFRPNVELGRELGFLPGTVAEKFEPWTAPIINDLNLIYGGVTKSVEALRERGELAILPFNYIRGATFSDAFVIIDETQNLSPELTKTAITRMGEGTKVVLTGDLRQIDDHRLDPQSNGLAFVMAHYPGEENYGNLILMKSERSFLAEQAERIFSGL